MDSDPIPINQQPYRAVRAVCSPYCSAFSARACRHCVSHIDTHFSISALFFFFLGGGGAVVFLCPFWGGCGAPATFGQYCSVVSVSRAPSALLPGSVCGRPDFERLFCNAGLPRRAHRDVGGLSSPHAGTSVEVGALTELGREHCGRPFWRPLCSEPCHRCWFTPPWCAAAASSDCEAAALCQP